ncbi:Glycosyltransferase involved in cell wall bisynthesis [Raineyella antarctica]|uniref:Glycosyltransferase involved in cell wall bisynthesis n=1 Tax=Raineyella antarctica TaxID=1577474 RepID=A0A1G6H6T2_9ACTN|nr:glycosyltransferase family 4 protein [Raineyella antarctica]SDB89874.1 Glycosyltransferase involved in cell wall bisynthesis [Raineyella antarctica]
MGSEQQTSDTPSSARPRALIAAPFYPPHIGGIERYSANVAQELVDRGWQVDVLACGPRSQEPTARPGPGGEAVHELDAVIAASRLPIPLPTRRNRAILRTVQGSYDFTLVQSHLFISGLLATSLSRGGRRVWLNHGSGHVPTDSRLLNAAIAGYEHVLALLLRRRVDAQAAVSNESAAWMRHLGVRGAVGVGNAVASVAPARGPREPGPLRVLYAGRLEPGKGADEAIEMVEKARSAGPIELTICGDGSQRPAIEELLRDRPAAARYLGPIPHDELLALMGTADVFIYPSTYPEGFPTVLLEAGAQGCAVLTYPVAGTAELLAEGGGWRVTDRDQGVAALSAAAQDPAAVTSQGEVMRRSIETRFTWTHLVDRLLAL